MVFLTLTPVNKSTKFGLKKLFLLFFLLEKKKKERQACIAYEIHISQ
jgi:hypothetical protein